MKKFINIFGLKVQIKFVDLTGQDFDGLYNGETQTILIEKSLTGKHRQQVLVHEVIHAALDRIGIHQLNISRDAEEIICEQLSVFLVEEFNLKV